MNNSTPLVSVVVISYNAAETVLETLDSIYAQTYQKLELILSDDCSSDDTVALAQQWASTHADRFFNCIIHKNPENLGVPENLNTGIRLSSGHYIKDLAADDLLLPDCISRYVDICQQNNWDNVCGQVRPFCVEDGQKKPVSGYELEPSFFEKCAADQYPDMLVVNRLASPAFFCTRALIEKTGYYDQRYKLMEDYPMYLKMSRSGVHLHLLNEQTVEYRISATSISNATGGRAVRTAFHQCERRFFYQQRLFPLLKYRKLKRVLSLMRTYACNDLAILFGNNMRSIIVRFFVKLANTHAENGNEV